MKVLIVVTHLLGTGHLSRALTLARGFVSAGHRVQVVSGGLPAPHLQAPGVEVVQLAPLRSDGTDFTRLLTPDGTPADAAYRAGRQQDLCRLVTEMAPDVLLTELFPFGRRSLTDEFTALLETARSLPRRPLILCSIRDILAPPSTPQKAERTDTLLARFYDAVLVHADPALVRLEQSWPVSDNLRPLLHYTGFVAPPPAGPHPDHLGRDEILVSAGGGAVGLPIFRTAIASAALMPGWAWRLLVGGGAEQLTALRSVPLPANLTLEPARPDFRQMLFHAAASVSMCGYNTALDLLQAGPPAVLIPFDAGQEVEQGLRAESLARRPGMTAILSAELTPERLARALGDLLAAGRLHAPVPAMDGAGETVRLVTSLRKARP
jgi:predicted glycosyltransferase